MPVGLTILWLLIIIVAALLIFLRLSHRLSPPLQERWGNGRWASRLQMVTNWLLSAPRSDPPPSPIAVDPAPVPEQTTIEKLRGPVSALLGGGLLLVFMGQAIYRDALPYAQRLIFILMGLGGIAFVVAGQTAVRQRVPHWLVKPVQRLARYFHITPGQLVLLLWAPGFSLMASLAAGDTLVARHPFVVVSAWLIGLGCAVGGSLERGTSYHLRLSRKSIWITVLLFTLAFFLRGTVMDNIPTTLSGDEGAAGLVAASFARGDANNPFAMGWFSFPSLYFAVQSVGISLWGRTAAALRLTSAVAGALVVVAAYWLARAMFDRVTAVLTAVYLSASHYHIHVSRIGLNNVWDSLSGTLAILGLWHGWHTGTRLSFILCGLALGIGQYFYVSIRTLPLLFLIWAGVAFLYDRDLFTRRLPALILTAFTAVTAVLPLGLFYVRYPHEFTAPLNRVTIFGGWLDQQMAATNQTAVQIILTQMKMAALGFTQEPLRLLYEAGVPLLLPGAAALFLIGVLWAIVHFDLRYLLLLLPVAAVIVLSGIGRDPPAAQRYILAMPVVAVLLALPLGQAIKWLRLLWPDYQFVITALVTAVMLWLVLTDLNHYFFRAYDTFVLGGGNTETATEIAYYLLDQEPAQQSVYFFGFPRMGYYSLATIPYLAPEMIGTDVPQEPITAPPDWVLKRPTIFIFLPERLGELAYVESAYPGGDYQEFFSVRNEMLFATYTVDP